MPKENVIVKKNTEPSPKGEEKIESLLMKGKPLDLTKEQQNDVIKDLKAEFKAIKAERMDIDGEGLDYDTFLENMEMQKRGRMPKTAGRAYNMDCGLSKVKCGDIIRTIKAALFGVDPLFSISPRPGFAKGQGRQICSEQQQYLDYVLDEKIKLKGPIGLAADAATYKKVGVIKWVHRVTKEKRIKTEEYKGDPQIIGIDRQTGQPKIENKPLEEFLLIYGEDVAKDPEKYAWIAKRLIAGKTAKFDVEYDDIVYNDPFPKFIDNKNFYVRKDVEGYEGLCRTQLIVERVNFTYYQLKQLEKENEFVNIDKLIYDTKEGEEIKASDKPRENYASEDYNVLECPFYFKMNKDDEDYTKGIIWMAEEKEIYLGGIYYPLTTIGSQYVPHYATNTNTGFYQDSVAEHITDIHLSRNAILNHTLESAQMATTVTPIAPKKSDVTTQFLNNKWVNGMVIYAKAGEIDFLSNRMRPPDVGALLILDQTLSQIASEITGSSDLKSGKETPLDPNAPFAKTALLLEQSTANVKDYVDEFRQGFEIDAQIILRMYHEMSEDEQEFYDKRYKAVTGANPLKISRATMIAKTNIQSLAMSYDFNKLNAKREDIAMDQYLTNQSLVANNPRANYEKIRIVMAGWSPKWKNAIDKILPPPEQFQAEQAQIAMQAVQLYFREVIKEAQTTQKDPQLDPEAMVAFMTKLQAMSTMPVDKVQEIQKQEAKAAKQ